MAMARNIARDDDCAPAPRPPWSRGASRGSSQARSIGASSGAAAARGRRVRGTSPSAWRWRSIPHACQQTTTATIAPCLPERGRFNGSCTGRTNTQKQSPRVLVYPTLYVAVQRPAGGLKLTSSAATTLS